MNINELKQKSVEIRKSIIEMLYLAGSGHSGGALGLADIFAVLYFETLNITKANIKTEKRDFLFLSNGHTCPVLYAVLALKGFFNKEELKNLRKINSKLQGHPHNNTLPGIENSGGPLGQGVSQAVGLASVLKRDKLKNRVYVIVGDGELEEGQCWEAILFAQSEKLDNLTIIVDRNNIQIDGTPKSVINLDKLEEKFSAFNCRTITFDGNNINQIREVLKFSKKNKDHPLVLIANTVPGKGVSFMENKFEWHGKAPNKEQKEIAIKELELQNNI